MINNDVAAKGHFKQQTSTWIRNGKRYEVYAEKQYVTIDEKNITQVFLSKQCYHINSCLLKVFKKT